MALRFLVTMALLHSVMSYPHYQHNIPNGHAVPDPCNSNHCWPGVGHLLKRGGDRRNSFGLDFQRENHTWTKCLCEKDSDGDGRTNGEELGDPDCVWKVGDEPKDKTNVTHPAICDPWDSKTCLSMNVTGPQSYREVICKANEFVCDGLKDEDVKNVSLRLPANSKVPSNVTTYMCQIFDFEEMTGAGDYRIIAMEPVIENSHVVHHIVMFGCSDEANSSNSPYVCGMADQLCDEVIGIWTLGLPGICFHPDIGIRVGAQGFKRVAIQLHWNNPQQLSGYTDSSGLLVYYTSKRRIYDAAILVTGVVKFELPPLTRSIQLTSRCMTRVNATPSSWTPQLLNDTLSSWTPQLLNGTINVTMAANHMHYAGTRMSVQLIRNNKFITNLTNDEVFKYDSPVANYYTDSPVQIFPGDELITKCEYSTLSRTTPTKFGQATHEEMCFAFIVVYPKENLRHGKCVTRQQDLNQTCLDWIGDEDKFQRTDLYKAFRQSCSDPAKCSDECSQNIKHQTRVTGCLGNKIFQDVQNNLNVTHDLVTWMTRCEYKANTPALNQTNSSSFLRTWPCLLLLVSVLMTII